MGSQGEGCHSQNEMFWLYSYLLTAECGLCILLMLIAYMPRVIRNPLKHVISKLDVPFSGQVLTAFGIALLAALVDSCLKAKKHTHPDTDGWKDKMEHTAKRRGQSAIYTYREAPCSHLSCCANSG